MPLLSLAHGRYAAHGASTTSPTYDEGVSQAFGSIIRLEPWGLLTGGGSPFHSLILLSFPYPAA